MSEQQPIRQGDWQALILRLTAFTTPSERVSGDEWWETLVGHPSETQTKRKSLVSQEVGQLASGQLILTIEPGRIDWRLVPLKTEELPVEEIPMIGGVSQGLDVFTPLMRRWLQEFSPNLQRLAFGADLALPVTSRVEGYEQIASYLRYVNIDPQRSQDLLYQINRPRSSRTNISNLTINRLSKWSVKMLAIGQVSMGQTINLAEFGLPFCSLEVDINTAAEFEDVFSRDQLLVIFDDLVDMGMEIAREGDIP
jgi:hypothetical protein